MPWAGRPRAYTGSKMGKDVAKILSERFARGDVFPFQASDLARPKPMKQLSHHALRLGISRQRGNDVLRLAESVVLTGCGRPRLSRTFASRVGLALLCRGAGGAEDFRDQRAWLTELLPSLDARL
jgi:hypothetical protein